MCVKIRWDGWKNFGWGTKQGLRGPVVSIALLVWKNKMLYTCSSNPGLWGTCTCWNPRVFSIMKIIITEILFSGNVQLPRDCSSGYVCLSKVCVVHVLGKLRCYNIIYLCVPCSCWRTFHMFKGFYFPWIYWELLISPVPFVLKSDVKKVV